MHSGSWGRVHTSTKDVYIAVFGSLYLFYLPESGIYKYSVTVADIVRRQNWRAGDIGVGS